MEDTEAPQDSWDLTAFGRFPMGTQSSLVVKTTDAYRIDLQKIANYRRELTTLGQVDEERSSILIVVGRQDTGDLEAQVRGSRRAWDVRLISIDALLRLMLLKEKVDDPATIQRICNILIPREFTRLDEIIDVVFSTAEETVELEPETVTTPESDGEEEKSTPVAFHGACITQVEQHFNRQLLRQTRSSYASADGQFAVVCAVSKTHVIGSRPSYWFAFHPYQRSFLESTAEAFLILGCGSPKTVLAIPANDLFAWLPDMWTTQRDERFYWHIRIHDEGARYTWDRKAGLGRIDVTKYVLAEPLPNHPLQQTRHTAPRC
jgi:hypothetical protein